MQVVGGAIQRVNHPAIFAFFGVGAGFAGFFAEEIVLRVFVEQDVFDDFFSAPVNDANQVATAFFFYLDLVELA